MRKRTRRLLFWLAALIFVVASWVAVRTAQGYAYDFKLRTFVRTGAIAATVNTGAQLIIDGRTIGGTSFLGNRVGDDKLLPDTYDVRIARDGYSSWRKDVVVTEGMLTDFPKVMLLPIDDEALLSLKEEASDSLGLALTLLNAVVAPSPSPKPAKTPTPVRVVKGPVALEGVRLLDVRTASASLIADHVLGFAMNDNESRLLWWTRNELWVMWLRNTDYQPYRAEGERQAVTRFSVPIVRAAWFRDADHVVADLGNESYRVIETDARGGTNIIKI